MIFSCLDMGVASSFAVEIGDDGGYETTGYAYLFGNFQGTNSVVTQFVTTGFTMTGGLLHEGQMRFNLTTANQWQADHMSIYNTSRNEFGVGRKELSGTLDRIKIRFNGSPSGPYGNIVLRAR